MIQFRRERKTTYFNYVFLDFGQLRNGKCLNDKKTNTKIKPYRFNTIKTDADLNDTQKFSSYLTENEFR